MISLITDFLFDYEIVYVEWDGVLYKTPTFNNEVDGARSIGNVYLYDSSLENTGEPFFIAEGMSSSYLDFTSDSAGEHTYTIYTGTASIKTLDEKYIPDTIARVGEVETIITNAITTALNTEV